MLRSYDRWSLDFSRPHDHAMRSRHSPSGLILWALGPSFSKLVMSRSARALLGGVAPEGERTYDAKPDGPLALLKVVSNVEIPPVRPCEDLTAAKGRLGDDLNVPFFFLPILQRPLLHAVGIWEEQHPLRRPNDVSQPCPTPSEYTRTNPPSPFCLF